MRRRFTTILPSRPEVDAKRIGVMAISLGGYYAPRAAAFEQRFACCIAWGAQWDYQKIWRDRFERLARVGYAVAFGRGPTHLMGAQCRIAGRGDQAPGAVQARRRGAEDHLPVPDAARRGRRADPAAEAQKCFDAVGSKKKTFKLFTRDEGGYHHCQIDNQSICSAYMWDWLEEVLEPGR